MSGVDPGVPGVPGVSNAETCRSRLCLICGQRPSAAGGPYTTESSPWCERCWPDSQQPVSRDDAESAIAELDRKIAEADQALAFSAQERLRRVVRALTVGGQLASWLRGQVKSHLFLDFVQAFDDVGTLPTVGALAALGRRAMRGGGR